MPEPLPIVFILLLRPVETPRQTITPPITTIFIVAINDFCSLLPTPKSRKQLLGVSDVQP
jgi:hypothetical protein